MKIMVAVKRVIDYAVKIRVKPDKVSKHTNTNTHCFFFFFWVKCLILIFIYLSDGRGDPEREDVDEPILRDSAGGGSKNQRGWHGL